MIVYARMGVSLHGLNLKSDVELEALRRAVESAVRDHVAPKPERFTSDVEVEIDETAGEADRPNLPGIDTLSVARMRGVLNDMPDDGLIFVPAENDDEGQLVPAGSVEVSTVWVWPDGYAERERSVHSADKERYRDAILGNVVEIKRLALPRNSPGLEPE